MKIRQMRETDIAAAMALKDAESWNQTEADWRFFLNSDPGLCLVACASGDVIGTVTAINYEEKVSWIGMMLVSSAHRRQGVGSALLKAIIERLRGRGSIKLDATPAGAKVYRKLGFEEEYELVRMNTEGVRLDSMGPHEGSVRRVEERDIPDLCRLDEEAFGANRSDLIIHLWRAAPDLCWLTKRNEKVVGFSMGRKGTRYTHIGPVVADSSEDASALVAQILQSLEGRAAILDVLDAKP